MKVLILGGTGVISRAITVELLSGGHEVVLYNRGGNKTLPFLKDVEQIKGDRTERDAFRAEMVKRKFDAVIDMICFNKADAVSTLDAFKDNVEQIVITSSVAAYKRPYKKVPTLEDSEEFWDDPVFAYAYNKAEMEKFLWPAAEKAGIDLTVIRPSLTYGPGAANVGVLRQNYGILDRIRKGKPLVMFGDGSTPWTWTFAPDLAKAYVGVLLNAKTYGKVYHACSEELHRWEDLYLTFGKIVGKEPKIIHLPADLLYRAAPNLCNHLFFEKTFPGLFANDKARADITGFKCSISLEEGLTDLARYFEKEAAAVDPKKDALEDRLVDLHEQLSRQMTDLYMG